MILHPPSRYIEQDTALPDVEQGIFPGFIDMNEHPIEPVIDIPCCGADQVTLRRDVCEDVVFWVGCQVGVVGGIDIDQRRYLIYLVVILAYVVS